MSKSCKAKANPFHTTTTGPSMAEMAKSSQQHQLGLQQVCFLFFSAKALDLKHFYPTKKIVAI